MPGCVAMKSGHLVIAIAFGLLCPLHIFTNPISNDFEINWEYEDAYLTVPQILRKYGYPVESHKIITEDGYILTAHRIPYSKHDREPSPGRPVVWLQHGLLCDSASWIINDEDKALAYMLVNRGYDVWLGNARGNSYSKEHTELPPKYPEFWEFSWHEMGVYDVPAVLEYILTTTGQDQLDYVGHSMGTTMFFVAMSMKPELNAKIRLMSALAPVTWMDHMSSPLKLITPYVNELEWILRMLGMKELLPSGPLMEFLGKTICADKSQIKAICSNILFLISGYNVDQLNTTMIPFIMGHTPAGSSVGNLVHYAQGVNSGKFRQYDYGTKENLEIYGTPDPPVYDVKKITAPVAIYWGQNDWLTSPIDVYRLVELLPNLVRKYRVRHDQFNHLDFLFSMDVDFLLNNDVIDFMELHRNQ